MCSFHAFQAPDIIVCHLLRRSGTPIFYRDVILTIPGSDDGSPEWHRKFDKVTYNTLQKVLDRQGCDSVQDPFTKEWVDLEILKAQLQDNMLLTARRGLLPMENRVRVLTKW